MPVYYRLGDSLCLTSISETWGLVVNEFLASTRGALILSDRVGCAEDLVHCGKDGIVVSYNDIDLLQNAMKQLVILNDRPDGRHGFKSQYALKQVARAICSQLQC